MRSGARRGSGRAARDAGEARRLRRVAPFAGSFVPDETRRDSGSRRVGRAGWTGDGLALHGSNRKSSGATSAVTTAFSPMATPEKVPATGSTENARAVPMPWETRPTAKPRAA